MRDMPYGYDLKVYNGSVDVTGQTVVPGTQLRVDLSMRNPNISSQSVRGRVVIDREKASGYDFDQTGASYRTIGGGNGTLVESFNWTPSVTGDYYAVGGVQTSGVGYTDGWAWGTWKLVTIQQNGQPDWTIMVFLNGDNDLEGSAIRDLNEMEQAGSTENVKIIVQFDRSEGWWDNGQFYDDTSNGNWQSAKRYLVTQDTDLDSINSTEIQDLGEVDMGDPDCLRDFATWGIANYPANHYALIIWDHGSGWKLAKRFLTPIKAISSDWESGNRISMDELRTALADIVTTSSTNIDIIGLDACLMAMLEVDYQIMDYGSIRVGSEETEPGDGWEYNTTLTALINNSSMTPFELASQIVDDYAARYGTLGDETQSAIDITQLSPVISRLNSFASSLIINLDTYRNEIIQCRNRSQEYDDPTYIDLFDFVNEINNTIPTIQEEAQLLLGVLDNCRVREYHGQGRPGSHGMSIYFPTSSAMYLSRYETDIRLPGDTQWDEFLNAYYAGSGPNQVATPSYTPPPGSYSMPQVVEIFCNTTGSTIYYTIDETDPDESGQVYSDGTPISVTATTTIRARAYKSGWTESEIAEGVYVIGGPPDWSVNVPDYQYSMNLIGVILFDGDESTDTNDKIGAFVDGECRGVASPSQFPPSGRYTFGMTIYSNVSTCETVSFKAWDASENQVYGDDYGLVLETYHFDADKIIGSDWEPEELHAVGVIPYSKAVVAGWNWFSVNVQASDMSLNATLASLDENGAFIKNQVAFSTYYPGYGWYSSNGLDSLDSRTMYMMKMNSPDTISYMGTPYDGQTPINLAEGWNWIGYPCQEPNSLGNALSSIEGIGVFIKNQVAFSTYYAQGGYGWYSSNGLDNLEPKDGYMLKTNATGTLIYPVPGGSGLAKGVISKSVTSNTPNWSVNPYAFEHSMAVTGVVIVDGVESNDGSDVVGAFVGDECRGVSSLSRFPLTGRYIFELLVYGEEGEEIHFRLYDADTDAIKTLEPAIPFSVDGIVGNGLEPYRLSTSSTSGVASAELPEEYALGQNYPNPFNPETVIQYQLPKQGHVTLIIYNMMGQEVKRLVESEKMAGYHEAVWDGTTDAGVHVESGIYLVLMRAGSFSQTRKLLFVQ